MVDEILATDAPGACKCADVQKCGGGGGIIHQKKKKNRLRMRSCICAFFTEGVCLLTTEVKTAHLTLHIEG